MKGSRRKPYIARAFLGRNEKGRSIYQTIGYFESRQEGLDALVLHRHNPVTSKANMTLKELYDEWSAGAFQRISKQTADNYRTAWNRLSKHKAVKVKEIRAGQFQGIIDACHKDGMSRSTLEKIRTTAVLMFTYAMENDIINKNYAKFIRLPKKEKAQKDRFTDLEIKKLFERAADEWTSSILIMIYTGLRINELLGLTRFNVDIDQGIITGGIKTDAGKNRIVPIHPKILKYVKAWHEKDGERLICEEGKAINARRYREYFYYPALEVAGVRKLTPHKCRHTFCTMLAEKGADTLAIQKLAGHADYGFTANEYTHPEVGKLVEAINKI